MLSWEYPPHIVGGLARHVHALSIELVKRNYDVHVIASKPNDSTDYELSDGVHIHRVSPLNDQDPDFLAWIGGLNLAIIDKAIAIAGHTAIHAVHTHDWMTGPAAEYIKKVLTVPMVATIHGTEYGRNKGIFTELQQFIFAKEKELSQNADKVIVCSDFMAEEISEVLETAGPKITVIPNGTTVNDHITHNEKAEKLFPYLKERKVVFSIGRVVKEKGFDTLIKSAELLRHRHPELCFVIAGNGPLLETYRQKVNHLSLSNTVFFIGFVSDNVRKALFEFCSMAVFPSLYEPFGLAAAEALSFGVPTIVSQTGGLQGLIEDRKTGYYMEPGNEKSLANIIEHILEHESLASNIAERGKAVVEEKFSWRQNAKQTDQLYENILTRFS
jgi:glycogen synthase